MRPQTQLDVFVRALHRRMVAVRALERLGLGLLAGCAVCLLLMPILIWRGEATGTLAVAALGTGGVAGLLWALAHRPTKLQAAFEADRQLGLSDLLGTALTLSRDRREPMEATVLAMAEARCRGVSPSAIALNRLGVRSWGGIALAGALVVGLGLFGGQTPDSSAQASGPRSWQEIEAAQDRLNNTHMGAAPDLRRAHPGTGGDDDDHSPDSTQSQSEDGNVSTAKTSASSNGAGSSEQGTGAGAAASASKGGDGAHHDPVTGGNTAGGARPDHTAGGGGTAATSEGAGGDGNAGATGGTTGARHVPAWRAQGWPAAQEAARDALRGGKIPDAYRPLVRDYFERESGGF
jgi:hypothetical protein